MTFARRALVEAWVANLGDAQFGFLSLSGAGRLVLKDVLMLAGSVLMIADSAKQLINGSSVVNPENKRVSG